MREGYEHLWRHGHGHLWGHGYDHVLAYGHGWGPAMPYMMLSNLFLIALFIALAMLLIHVLTTSNLLGEKHRPGILPNYPSALEPLRQRSAHAEIEAIPLEPMQEQRETSSWQKHRRSTDLLKDEQPMSWME